MIVEVTEHNIETAGYIHAMSWQESHRSFCSAEFVAKHTPAAQTEYLRRELAAGKRIFLLTEESPVGIVSVDGNLIENLYVLPWEQGKGHGTRLLRFAMEQCAGTPTLWILNNNEGARRLYVCQGFRETGRTKPLTENLWEVELSLRLTEIRRAERESHLEAYASHELYAPGSWLAKPVGTVTTFLAQFRGYRSFRALDLGCGVGRNSIPVVKAFGCTVDCVDILEEAIGRLEENAVRFGVSGAIRGIVSSIDEFEIPKEAYDLILGVSALEHVDSRETFRRKLEEIREGTRPGGGVCLIINSNVTERDGETGGPLEAQFEVNLDTGELRELLARTFAGWAVWKETVVHQSYRIPRGQRTAQVETDVVTFAARRQ